MLRRFLVTAAAAAVALTTAAAPAGASSAAATSVRSSSVSARPGGTDATQATTIGWAITAYKCGPAAVIGAQSKQAKNGPDVNRLVSTHQLQRFQGGRWVTVASRSFQKTFPVNGVYYYAPSPSTRLDWNLRAFGHGDYRVNVVFRYYRGSFLVATRVRNTVQQTGGFCRF